MLPQPPGLLWSQHQAGATGLCGQTGEVPQWHRESSLLVEADGVGVVCVCVVTMPMDIARTAEVEAVD